MIINNSPALGSFGLRDEDGATLDATTYSDNTKFAVRDGKETAIVQVSLEDQFEFTKWLAVQLSDEQRAELKASL